MSDPDPPTGDPPGPEWFQRVADTSGLVFFILRIRPDLAFEFVNGGMRTQLVGHRADGTGAPAELILSRVHPDSAGTLSAVLGMRPGQSMVCDITWSHPTGRSVRSRGTVECRERPDGSVVIEGALHDVTHLHQVQAELRNSEKRHRLLAENAWDVVWTMALDGSITYVSPAVEQVRGLTPEEAMSQTLEEIHPPASAVSVGAYFAELFAAVAAGTEPPTFRGELEYYRRDGSIMTGELQVIPHVDADGDVIEIIGVTRDISERKRFEEDLTRLAVTDPLTGLWNRRHTAEILTAELAHSPRRGGPLSLLMIDVDNFKAINDSHGHHTGDRVLIEVAHLLRERVRGTDVLGRWGGEEFVVLLRLCRLRDAVQIAEKLRGQVADTVCGGLAITVSIGAAQLLPDEDLPSWLGRADAALYQAKRSGRNAVIAREGN